MPSRLSSAALSAAAFALALTTLPRLAAAGKRPALVVAVDKGDLPRLEKLLKKAKRRDLEAFDDAPRSPTRSMTPLQLAARRGNAAAVEALLAAGATPTAVALDAAAAAGHLELVKRLHAAGAGRPDIALREAIKNNHAEVVAFLLPLASADPLYDSTLSIELAVEFPDVMAVLLAAHPDLRKATRLLAAALRLPAPGVARALIEAGAPVDAEDGTGRTPLMIAAETNQRDLAELLLAHHANPRLVSSSGETVLTALVRNPVQNVELLDVLLGPPHQVPINLTGGPNQVTALMVAAGSGSVGWTQLLLERKASVVKRSKDRRFPIDFALDCTLTPGTWAAPSLTRCWGDVALVLLKAKAPFQGDFEARGRTLLGLAFMSGNEELALKVLYQPGTRDTPDQLGNSALHYAARFATPLAVQELLSLKLSDPSATNDAGESPLHIARAAGRADVVALLRAAGAK